MEMEVLVLVFFPSLPETRAVAVDTITRAMLRYPGSLRCTPSLAINCSMSASNPYLSPYRYRNQRPLSPPARLRPSISQHPYHRFAFSGCFSDVCNCLGYFPYTGPVRNFLRVPDSHSIYRIHTGEGGVSESWCFFVPTVVRFADQRLSFCRCRR
jgi:hypothetical protein